MKTGEKVVIALVMVMFLMCTVFVPASLAMGEKGVKKASEDVVKATITYPANVVNEAAKVVVGAAKKTGNVVKDTAKAAGDAFLAEPGNVEKASEIVTIPTEGSIEVTKDVAVGTVEVPVEAGRKTGEQLQ